MTPRVLVVQHEDDDPIHRLGEWMAVDLDVRRPYVGDDLPGSLAGHAAMVVMGGVMGAHDDAAAPWLPQVRELIRGAAADRVPSLGICLGHQLTAVALGGEALPNPRGRQLGLVDVGWEADAHLDELFSAVATPRGGLHWTTTSSPGCPRGPG